MAETDSKATILRRQFALVAACFLVSGFAALLYETVWLRQFAILLGTSEQALAVVLASYMGGLAIGSLVASRVVDRIRRPLWTYGLLEFGIAVTALLVPVGISVAYSIQSAVLGGQAEPPDAGGLAQIIFCFGTAFGLISIPTALMGATLPLLARHVVDRNEDLGPKIGRLYAINTAGAVLGTMAAAFIFLPVLGLAQTTWVGVASNLIVFLIVLAIVRNQNDAQNLSSPRAELAPAETGSSKKTHEPKNGQEHSRRRSKKKNKHRAPSDEEAVNSSRFRWILALAAVSGAVSFCYEILFTRMLGHFLGGSVYAFATMLSGFLLGITLGGAIASRLTQSRQGSAVWFVYAQVAAAICTLITYHTVNHMVVWPWNQWGGGSAASVQVFASIIALLPTATCIGATFPLAIRIYAKDESEAASGSARVYFWNVLGGIAGALATGVFVLPVLQYHGAAALAITMNILIAIAAMFILQVNRSHLVLPVIALVLLASRFPSAPENVLRVSALDGQISNGDVLFNHVGKSATVTVFGQVGRVDFQTNGLPEASLSPLGAAEISRNSAHWLSSLPTLMRPECRSMLIIGLGGGVAAERVPKSIESIDILEIEPAVIDANRVVAGRRDRDPLSDDRITIILNDARNALALSDKKYDVIISQPSHPWTAGASHLYSREFATLASEHLNPGGVFLQWMNTQFIDVELAKSMGASLIDVFPHVRLYEPAKQVFMFVGSDQPMRPEDIPTNESGQTLCHINPQDQDHYRRMGIVTPTHLFSLLRMEDAELRRVCADARRITDERNLLAMRAPRLLRMEALQSINAFLNDHLPVARSVETATDLCPSIELPVYLASILNKDNHDWVREVGNSVLKKPAERARLNALIEQVTGDPDALDRKLAIALESGGSSDMAVQLLSNKLLSKPPEISEAQEQKLQAMISKKHRLILDLLEKLVADDLEAAKQYDTELANWPVDDAAFNMAVRLRLPWRLESPPEERARRCDEAINIIDLSAPFLNASSLAFFRVSAAVKANRPEVALGSVAVLTSVMNQSIDKGESKDFETGVPILASCYTILRDDSFFRFADQNRYRAVRRSAEDLLRLAGILPPLGF